MDGKCDLCGNTDHVIVKNGLVICDECIKTLDAYEGNICEGRC